jgi:hypothetical protein
MIVKADDDLVKEIGRNCIQALLEIHLLCRVQALLSSKRTGISRRTVSGRSISMGSAMIRLKSWPSSKTVISSTDTGTHQHNSAWTLTNRTRCGLNTRTGKTVLAAGLCKIQHDGVDAVVALLIEP